MQAGDCEDANSDGAIVQGTLKNLFTDFLSQTDEYHWENRNMPKRGLIIENPWSTVNKSWQDAYQIHQKNILSRYNFGSIKNIGKLFVNFDFN